MAANLREALRTVPMLSERYGRVLVMVDSPVLQVPADEFKEDLAETYYNHSSYTGAHSKLYSYFHEHQLEVFSFAQNRFKFCNSFTVTTPEDAIYYILASWKQLGLVPEHDELFLVGDVLERDHTKEELEKYIKRVFVVYIKRVFVVNPIGEFNRASVAQIPGIPYDLMALYVKGL